MNENHNGEKDHNERPPGNGNGDPSDGNAEEQTQPLISHLFRNHPGFIITFAYLFCSAIGLSYLNALFNRFGINVFDYAEANDFLVAAFKNLTVFSFNLVVIFFAVFWKIGYDRQRLKGPTEILKISGGISI